MRKRVVLFLWIACFFVACDNDVQRNKSHANVSAKSIEKGKALAIVYCQRCHTLPDPNWIDTKTWNEGVLPNMGPMLGIFKFNDRDYPSYSLDPNVTPGFYPSSPLISNGAWQNIIDYYTATAPDTLHVPQEHLIAGDNKIPFVVTTPSFGYMNPAIAYADIDTVKTNPPLIVSDALKRRIYRFDKNLNLADSIDTHIPIVNTSRKNNNWVACSIGILNPSNGSFGSAHQLKTLADGKVIMDTATLFNKLQRPVQVTEADLNNDGRQDYLVCEFGFLTGELAWMENKGDSGFAKHVIRPFPGAIKAYIEDYNHDGLPDIWVLFSQAMEGIYLFTNKGNGNFESKQVLSFPPIQGSSYFEFDDFNKDGRPDILYTCGDNADYSTVLKPYHGIYIFMNEGNLQFKQSYFFHFNGCYKAVARDFDKDGDLDIAAISYFADYKNHPEESFVYLENKGANNFKPYSLKGTEAGRWLTMNVGDIDNDGDDDIVLGNFALAPSFEKSMYDWKKGPLFLVLQNKTK